MKRRYLSKQERRELRLRAKWFAEDYCDYSRIELLDALVRATDALYSWFEFKIEWDYIYAKFSKQVEKEIKKIKKNLMLR